MPTGKHPSRFNPDVLKAMAPILCEWALPIHDPFAGTGERLAALAASLDLTFTGTEIEAPFIRDASVVQGDSTRRETYPDWEYCVVTSPVYPNGMTDHFEARDKSKRYTYRQALAAITGRDQPLHGNNMGRYGPRGGGESMEAHCILADRCVRWWPDRVLVNVKDCYIDGHVYPVVAGWRGRLGSFGYQIRELTVLAPGNRHGANFAARVDHEVILIATRT